MTLEKAPWMSAKARTEVCILRQTSPNALRNIDHMVEHWVSGLPNVLLVNSLCALGLQETFQVLQGAFGIGIDGEGAAQADEGYGVTPLIVALRAHRHGSLRVLPFIEWLLEHGAVVNPPVEGLGFNDIHTPVQASVHHMDTLGLVLAHGGDVKTTLGTLPHHAALSAWFEWAQNEQTKQVMGVGIQTLKCLLAHGADPAMAITNPTLPGVRSNLLVCAAQDPKLRLVIGEMVSLGIDVHAPGPDGMSVHHLATDGSMRGAAKKRKQMQDVLAALERHALNTTLPTPQTGGATPMRL
jgi:hypothetical protein